ncbi:MAG: Gfo/Idh/MocA family oxidoreductase [Spirochaetota bacterium]
MKRIGFVGAGKHTQCIHLPNYAVIPDCQIAAITDVDADLAKRVAAHMNIPKSYGSHTDMLAHEKLDAVCVTLPATPMAETVIRDCLAAKLPVCVEKPLAWSVASGERIVADAKKHGTLLVVGYHKRSDPASIYAKGEIERFVKSGELGPMRYARLQVTLSGDWIENNYRLAMKGNAVIPPMPFPAGDHAKFNDKAKGKFFSFAGAHSHQLDLMRCLLGDAYTITYADPTGVMFAIASAHGVPGVMEFSPYNATDWREYGIIYFEKGYVRVDLPAPLAINRPGRTEVYRNDGATVPTTTVATFPAKSAMVSQAENFIRMLNGEKGSLCPASEALESIGVAEDWAMRLFPN